MRCGMYSHTNITKFMVLKIILLLLVILTTYSTETFAQVSGAQFDTHPMHWARYWARGLFDRNLVWAPMWNIGNVADSGVDPGQPVYWPGSSAEGLSYVGNINFFVAGKIHDMTAWKGKPVPDDATRTAAGAKEGYIISDSFLPHIAVGAVAQLSYDRTHQQIWQPMPGYFNDGKDGYVWGINEDINQNGSLEPEEDINYNGQLDVHLDPPESILKSMAISTDKRTWPEYWPAGSYIKDEREVIGRPPKAVGVDWRAGRWNGEYKVAPIADQETLYLMDDHENDALQDYQKPLTYWPMKNADGSPNTTNWANGGSFGLGVEVENRGYAWFHPLAEDLLVSVYRVRNYSDHVLPHIITGMYANPNVGRAEYNVVDYIFSDIENIEDTGELSFNIMYMWQLYPEEIQTWKKIGTFGLAFLETPGIAYNDLDDDADGLLNESMSNGIDDDGDWKPFADVGLDRIGPDSSTYKGPDKDGTEGNGRWDTEDANMNGALDPGEDTNQNDKLDMEPVNDDRGRDGIGPDENGWFGADPGEVNGRPDLGEPNFDLTDIDEADQAGLRYAYGDTKKDRLKVDKSYYESYLMFETTGDDEIEETDEDIRISFASRAVILEQNDWRRFTIAIIMGEDQDDAIMNKSTMQNIYNNNYRFLTPPLQPTLVSNPGNHRVHLYWDKEAESSKDPFYGYDFNGYRVYKSTNPKFLDIKTITDAFGNIILMKPIAIYDRADDGGLKGAHPIPFPNLGVHYDMGDNTGLRHSYKDTLVDNGRTYYYAVTSIDAGNDDDFFERGIVSENYPMKAMPSESPFNITLNELGEVVYRDKNTAVVIPAEPAAGYTDPYVDSTKVRHISGIAAGGVLRMEVYNKHYAKLGHEYEIQFEDDGYLDSLTAAYKWGSTTAMRCLNLTTGDTLFNYKAMSGYDFSQKAFPEIEKGIYEGLKFFFSFPVNSLDRRRAITVNKRNKYGRTTKEWQNWQNETTSNVRLDDVAISGEGYALPFDLEIRTEDHVVDTALVTSTWTDKPYPLNFTVWNIADPNKPEQLTVKLKYGHKTLPQPPKAQEGKLWNGAEIVVMFKNKKGGWESAWRMMFAQSEFEKNNPTIPPQPGDVMRVRFNSNPTRFDRYRFTIDGGVFDNEKAKLKMRDIYVVPDPYVVSNNFETIYELAGFSQRRVDFVNLPPQCTIKIFTTGGKLVKTIEHSSNVDFSRRSWDLTTEDGPEVAFGIYFFVVESKELGISRGKFAVIK